MYNKLYIYGTKILRRHLTLGLRRIGEGENDFDRIDEKRMPEGIRRDAQDYRFVNTIKEISFSMYAITVA